MDAFINTLDVVAVVVAGTLVGNELAVAIIFHPQISRLDDATHARAAQALARALGRAMPFWYAATLILTLAVLLVGRTMGTMAWWLTAAAAGLWAAMIVYSVTLPVPINNKIANWQVESLPADWRQLRQRWDLLHAIRVAVDALALVLMVASLVV